MMIHRRCPHAKRANALYYTHFSTEIYSRLGGSLLLHEEGHATHIMQKTPDWLAPAAAALSAGKTYTEAACIVGVSPRHLRRVLKELADRYGIRRTRRRLAS